MNIIYRQFDFVNFILSNLKLRGKTLEFELKKPFDLHGRTGDIIIITWD